MKTTNNVQRSRECLDCGHKWTSPVTMSAATPNLSGEASAYCPACNSRAVMSGPHEEAKAKTAQGFLINPWNKTIQRVSHDTSDYREIYKLLTHPEGYPVSCFTVPAELANGDAFFIDDEGKLYGDMEKQRFWIMNLPDGVRFLIAGMALVLGTNDEGDTVSAQSDVFELAGIVQFIPDDDQWRAAQAAEDEIAAGPQIFVINDDGTMTAA